MNHILTKLYYLIWIVSVIVLVESLTIAIHVTHNWLKFSVDAAAIVLILTVITIKHNRRKNGIRFP